MAVVLCNANPLMALGKLNRLDLFAGLFRAHRQGLLSFDQTELLVHEIAARPDIWVAARLCEQVLASLHRTAP